MESVIHRLEKSKNIALVAHDHRKLSLLTWVQKHISALKTHKLFATGTTGNLIHQHTGLKIINMLSGLMGGDQQLGAMIAEQKIDILIFFWDPLNAVPHDPDIKALLRLATVWNIPVVTNIASADFIITSPAFDHETEIEIPNYQQYLETRIDK